MMSLDASLQGVIRLGFDTSPVIYFIEAHPEYDALVTEVFRRVEGGVVGGFTSVITLSEVLVHPSRTGDVELKTRYRELLLKSENFSTLSIDSDIASHAADLRARYSLRTPDALQMATAPSVGCEAFLTNDVAFARVKELRVLLLDELGA